MIARRSLISPTRSGSDGAKLAGSANPPPSRRDLPFQLEMEQGGGAGSPPVCVKCRGWHCQGNATLRNLAFSLRREARALKHQLRRSD